MLENKHDILIAALSIAELRRKYETQLPRVRNILVVPFDEEAADLLAREFPSHVFHEIQKADGTPLNYIKYDSLIVASACDIVRIASSRPTRRKGSWPRRSA